jgi:hypothetical protein
VSSSSRVGARRLRDRRPRCRVSSKCGIAPCRPNAGSGYHARARGLERAGCRTDTHAAVCRPNAGLRCVSSKCGIGVPCASSSSRVGARGLRDRRLCCHVSSEHGVAPCVVQTRDRGAMHELEGGGTDARAAVCRPNARNVSSKRVIGVLCASSRMGACRLRDRHPRCVSSERGITLCTSSRVAGPTPAPLCVVRTQPGLTTEHKNTNWYTCAFCLDTARAGSRRYAMLAVGWAGRARDVWTRSLDLGTALDCFNDE